ncbi:transcription factor NF-E2 45 kDa subunit isoform X2 [Ascaphus truei]|uniref:transcription factor NF-E2 45 kDa subunit isoform X2 n=1 Tax=Ascaphus truei TaxID=8439 RepID=UPI003F5A65E1
MQSASADKARRALYPLCAAGSSSDMESTQRGGGQRGQRGKGVGRGKHFGAVLAQSLVGLNHRIMPPCPPPQARTCNPLLPTSMGEQGVQGDMDLTWQEILSIVDLQGLDMQSVSTSDTGGYGTQAPILHTYGYGHGNFHGEIMTPNLNHNMPSFEHQYVDTITCQPQRLPTLPMVSAYGPTAYTGMLISSSMNQMGTMVHFPKNLPMSGLLSAPTVDHMSMSVGLASVHSGQQPHKGQEDFESDSGLSLNFSDGESIELESIESQRLQSEYIEMFPPLNYQDQYRLAPALSELDITDTHPYGASQAQELVCSRDERRAVTMNIPFPTERIVNLPVEDFNELLSRYSLTEQQLALVRDIRRRGKNKVAAQNCRKRKMENISILERELGQLQTEREGLRMEQEKVGKEMGDLKKKLELLQQEVLCALREESGHPKQPEEFLLKQTSDGIMFLAPHAEMGCLD